MRRWTSGDRVFGIRPPGPRQVVQRDAHAPPVRRGPDEKHAEQGDRGQAEDEVPSDQADVDDDDDRRDGQAVADRGERPCVAWISFVDEAARAAALQVCGKAREEGALATVGTPLAPAAADGRDRRCRAARSGQTRYLMRTRVPLIFCVLNAPRKSGTMRSMSSKYDDSAGVSCEAL